MDAHRYFEILDDDRALIVLPRGDVEGFAGEQSREVWGELSEQVVRSHKPVVLDLAQLDYFGSTVLDWIASMGRASRQSGLPLALCRVSDTGMEVVKIARFDELWPIFPTREAALDAAREQGFEGG